MKTSIKLILYAAVLAVACACSSDDETISTAPFTAVQAPHWAVDWSSNDPAPDWQEPAATLYECSMNLLVTLDEELQKVSSSQDQMAIFINGTCRGVSKPNVYPDGSVVFLIHIKGSSQETGQPMELQYYSGGAKALFNDPYMPPFTPNNLMDEAFRLVFDPTGNSLKYPLFVPLSVTLPEQLPFNRADGDEMAVFIDGECRGVLTECEDLYPGWRGIIVYREGEDKAELRFYSAEKGGVYTVAQGIVLGDEVIVLEAKF